MRSRAEFAVTSLCDVNLEGFLRKRRVNGSRKRDFLNPITATNSEFAAFAVPSRCGGVWDDDVPSANCEEKHESIA